MIKTILKQGDCLELMKHIKNESIDLILTDLPYGTSACKWDIKIPFEPLWEQYERIIKKEGAIVLFGSEPFSSFLRLSNLKLYKYDWKWEKPHGANFLNSKYQPVKCYEDIIVFGKGATSYSPKFNMKYNPQMEDGKPYYIKSGETKHKSGATVRSDIISVGSKNEGTRYPRAIQKFGLDKEKLHPTQKPIALLEYLIKTYSDRGGHILDSCMGSGSTGVACVNTDRNFIGFELKEGYFKIAEERINHAKTEKG